MAWRTRPRLGQKKQLLVVRLHPHKQSYLQPGRAREDARHRHRLHMQLLLLQRFWLLKKLLLLLVLGLGKHQALQLPWRSDGACITPLRLL